MAYPETTWSSSTTYAINNLVNYAGMDYISLANSNLDNVPSWTLSSKWNSYTSWLVGTTYAIGNTVDYQGWGYTSLANGNVGNTPVPGGPDLKWAKTAGDYALRPGQTMASIPGRAGMVRRASIRALVKPWESSGIFGRGVLGLRSPIAYMRITSPSNFLPFSGIHASTLVQGPFMLGSFTRVGIVAGRIKWGYSVPQFVVGPDGLIILIGAPFTAKLGVPT